MLFVFVIVAKVHAMNTVESIISLIITCEDGNMSGMSTQTLTNWFSYFLKFVFMLEHYL